MLTGRAITNRGQVLIIFVFAIIGLIGIVGLAVDGGDVYADRRHAQNAADTAALSAAVVKINEQKNGGTGCTDLTTPSVCGAKVLNTALDMASTNGYANNITDNTVEVHIPPIDGAYSNCSSYAFHCTDYVQVIIYSNVNTFFARVLGIGQLHNRVEAVALARYTPSGLLYDGNSMIQLKPTSGSCTGDFSLGGSGTVTLNGGGIFVNSDNSTCAFKETSSCITLVMNGATLSGIGGQSTSSCPNAPTMAHASSGYSFPPPEELFAAPVQCGQTPAASTTDADGYSHYYPGHYSSLPPAKNTRLDPGVYCIDNLIKTTNPNSNFVADNVFLYIKPGGGFSFQGGTVKLTAPTTGPYAGYLIYVDSDYTGTSQNCIINASSTDVLTGVIYAPYCDVVFNGGSSPTGLSVQLIAYTISLNGSADLIFNYNQSNAAHTPEFERTGLYH